MEVIAADDGMGAILWTKNFLGLSLMIISYIKITSLQFYLRRMVKGVVPKGQDILTFDISFHG